MSIYRNIAWYVSALRHYTKAGYENSSKSFDASDLNVDITNKVYMITGANSGIGKVCALKLAEKGAKVHMVCRNKERGEEAMLEIRQSTNNNNLTLHLLDMSNPREVYNFCQHFIENNEKLDVLINNAGCMVNSLKRNTDNLELNFATNTLSTFILTERLMDVLMKSNEPRVVTVSSGGMLVQKLNISNINFDKVDEKYFDGTMVYAQNKRQQVVMTQEWSKKYPSVIFSSMHPGWADTPAVSLSMPSFYEKHKNILRTPEQGADTIVWLAISQAALKHPNGEFFLDRTVVPQHIPLAWTKSSQKECEEFMEILEDYLKVYKNKDC